MSPEDVTGLASGLTLLVAAVAGVASGIITGRSRASSAEVQQLREELGRLREDMDEQATRHEEAMAEQGRRISARDRMIAHLTDWQLAARMYISLLRGILADNGIRTPTPPDELDLTRLVDTTPTDED